jgi:hypothetical protein
LGTRILIPTIILVVVVLMPLVSCDEGESTATADFIGYFTQASPNYIADTQLRGIDFLQTLFCPIKAYALPNLSITGEFLGPAPVPMETKVNVLGLSGELIATGRTDETGYIEIGDIPEGYLNIHVVGGPGKTWLMPTHFLKDHATYMRAVFKDNDEGKESVYAKSVHNNAGLPVNTDDFSIAIFGRPRSGSTGGMTILHQDGKTFIDNNGDGDFIDDDDLILDEADDDGIPSSAGDGDEDNDGITDINEQDDADDLDGDGLPNSSDDDDDGDNIPDSTDSTPRGITEFDDFEPPTLIDPNGEWEGDPYTGIADVQPVWLNPEQTEPDLGKVRVFFYGAEDEKNDDISYKIFYDENEIDFNNSPYELFNPQIGIITDPDELYDYELTGLTPGETYYFAVRALDSAPPPNEDTNENMLSLELPDS